jgi:hypothetical protein
MSSEIDSRDERPERLTDTTGEVAEVERLLGEVRDLGVVILAGPPLSQDAAIDLYTDLHVRGLTLIAGDPEGDADA